MVYNQNIQIKHSILKPFFRREGGKPFFLCIVNPRPKSQAKCTVFVFQGRDLKKKDMINVNLKLFPKHIFVFSGSEKNVLSS